MLNNVSLPHRLSEAPSARRQLLFAPIRRPIPLTLMVLTAIAVAASGAIHLYLWDIAYRHVATLGPLFLVQAFSAFVVALAIIATRKAVVLALAFALMIGTLLGFVLVLTTGLFGFHLGFVSGWAYLTMGAECLAVALIAVIANTLWRDAAGGEF
jgi:hypothetical protein